MLFDTGFKITKENLGFAEDLIIRSKQNLNVAKHNLQNKDYYAYIENFAEANEKMSKAVGLVFGIVNPKDLKKIVGHQPQEVYLLICKSKFKEQFEPIEKVINPNLKPLDERILEVEKLKNDISKLRGLDNSIPQIIIIIDQMIDNIGIEISWIIPFYLISFLISPHYKFVRYPIFDKENNKINPPIEYDENLNIIKHGEKLITAFEKSTNEFTKLINLN